MNNEFIFFLFMVVHIISIVCVLGIGIIKIRRERNLTTKPTHLRLVYSDTDHEKDIQAG